MFFKFFFHLEDEENFLFLSFMLNVVVAKKKVKRFIQKRVWLAVPYMSLVRL
jgi:hypothetical protein